MSHLHEIAGGGGEQAVLVNKTVVMAAAVQHCVEENVCHASTSPAVWQPQFQ